MSQEPFFFAWQVVQGGHQWIEATPTKPSRFTQGTKNRFLSTGHSIYERLPTTLYYPLKKHSGLFLEFARLDPEWPDNLLEFANQYGELGEWVGMRLRSSNQDYDGEPYEMCSAEIRAMHDAVELWNMLRTQD